MNTKIGVQMSKELLEWKEQMMKVHNELDLQGIGKALNLKLGTPIAPQVLPRIQQLIEMLERCQLVMSKSMFTPERNIAQEIEKLLKNK